MAQKKATVYILNASPSMGRTLPNHAKSQYEESQSILLGLLEEKAMAGRKSDVATVLLVGTEETSNVLAEEDQYQHITTLDDFKPPSAALLRTVANTTVTEAKDATGDMVDALILATHMMNEFCRHLKYERRIVVLTNGEDPVDWTDKDEIIRRIVDIKTSVLVVGLGGAKIENTKQNPHLAENTENWKAIVEATEGDMLSQEEALHELHNFRPKVVRPTPIFRGFLTLGDTSHVNDAALSISVTMYVTTMVQRPPGSKKYSALSNQPAKETGTHTVNTKREHKVKNKPIAEEERPEGEAIPDADNLEQDLPDEKVDESTIVSAGVFGKTLVPIGPEEEEVLKLKARPGMEILGLLSADAVPRDYFLGQVYVLTPGTFKPMASGTALSSFARCLDEKNAVALVRYVFRNDIQPKLGVLFPHFEENVDVLHFIQVPYNEDLRMFGFNSLDRVVSTSGKVVDRDHPLLPTQEMEELMDQFVSETSMYDPTSGEEYLRLDETYNPMLWRVEKAITTRALNEAAPIPELDDRLKAQLNFLPVLPNSKEEGLTQKLKDVFNVKKAALKEKRGYGKGNEGQTAGAADMDVDEIVKSKRVKKEHETDYNAAIESLVGKDVRQVSSLDPIGSFKAMVNNTKEDLITTAVEQMGNLIIELVTTSFADQHYGKALECLKTVRSTSAEENESDTFNGFMHRLKSKVDPGNPKSRRLDFWEMLKKEDVTLISKEEAEDSDVSPEQAKEFLEAATATAPEPEHTAEGDEGDEDDLLAQMLE